LITPLSIEIAKVALSLQEYAYTGNLSINIDNNTTLRDFVRLCFAEVGIEIAFSGKDSHEKGVVIDMDEQRFSELGFDIDKIRFGQTVVRVNPDIRPMETDELAADNLEIHVLAIMAKALQIAKSITTQ
jgi:GDP-D-mannose dehydratase